MGGPLSAVGTRGCGGAVTDVLGSAGSNTGRRVLARVGERPKLAASLVTCALGVSSPVLGSLRPGALLAACIARFHLREAAGRKGWR